MITAVCRAIVAGAVIVMAQPGTARADQACSTVNVAAAQIPHFVESSTEGVFVELIRAAATRAGLDVTISVYPKKRALRVFRTGRADALMPHSSAGVDVSAHKSTAILTKRDYVFVRRGTPVPTSIKDLEGLRVGLTQQYAYPKELTANTRILFDRTPNSDINNIKMLSAGRIDGSIFEERSGLKAIEEAIATDIIYDKATPISELLVWVLFRRDACGKVQADRINTAFAVMQSDGTWQKIMGR